MPVGDDESSMVALSTDWVTRSDMDAALVENATIAPATRKTTSESITAYSTVVPADRHTARVLNRRRNTSPAITMVPVRPVCRNLRTGIE